MKCLVPYLNPLSSIRFTLFGDIVHCCLNVLFFFSFLQLSMWLGLKMGQSFQNLMEWNSPWKKVS